jgi:hypothetical protein
MRERSATRRRFFMHPAHRTIGISTAVAAWQACRELAGPASDELPRPHRVCLLGSMPGGRQPLATILAERLRQSTAMDADFDSDFDGVAFRVEHRRPAALDLDSCDCLVLLPGATPLEDWQSRCIRRYGRRGGAMVLLGCSGLVFPGWPELARELTGATCRPPRAVEACRIVPAASARHHPILSGVRPFHCLAGLDAVSDLAADAMLLLTAERDDRMGPAAWARQAPGRVFSTTLGNADDYRQIAFLDLLVRAVVWACAEP